MNTQVLTAAQSSQPRPAGHVSGDSGDSASETLVPEGLPQEAWIGFHMCPSSAGSKDVP